jgi:predicted  nucleic acid-binding Zn-ribbon protein
MVDQNLDQQSSDAVNSVENALSALWDKAREASLLISTLREERKRLMQRISELDDEVAGLKAGSAQQQSEIESLKADAMNESGRARETVAIDAEEKRMLQQKVRSVIAKLDQYLTP